jgi:hypothetical protein
LHAITLAYTAPMPSTRSLRRALPFDRHFLARHPLLWPLDRAARRLCHAAEWPAVAAWGAVFAAGAPPIRFAVAKPRSRGRLRRGRGEAKRYDASINEDGRVPSRERHWHDFLNALVWGTFPLAKAALHRRQGTLVAARAEAPHRSREQDGLAMIDEGGAVALETPDGELRLVFGHAIYEGFVLGVRHMTARLVRLAVPALAADPLAQADAALAATLNDVRFSTLPDSLPRVFVPDTATAPWTTA